MNDNIYFMKIITISTKLNKILTDIVYYKLNIK